MIRVLLAAVLVAGASSACASGPDVAVPSVEAPAPVADEQSAGATSRNIDVAELSASLAAGNVPVLVDVRTPGEYASGHVAGAVNIPVDELAGRLQELEQFRQGDVYLICRSGGRSARAAASLTASGFDTVNVEGGTAAWIGAGLPVE
jgi:rhodanese-related sulfurtransferase